jgi:hypothetical protein
VIERRSGRAVPFSEPILHSMLTTMGTGAEAHSKRSWVPSSGSPLLEGVPGGLKRGRKGGEKRKKRYEEVVDEVVENKIKR